jgi:hypothetical protein
VQSLSPKDRRLFGEFSTRAKSNRYLSKYSNMERNMQRSEAVSVRATQSSALEFSGSIRSAPFAFGKKTAKPHHAGL